jgi:cell division protein FtsW
MKIKKNISAQDKRKNENEVMVNDSALGVASNKKFTDGVISRIIIAMTFLIAIGIVMIFSASKYDVASENCKKQLMAILLGLLGMLFAVYAPYSCWKYLTWVVLAAAIGFMELLRFPKFSVTANGATRWVSLPFIPFNIQVSDVYKLAIILLVAVYINKFWKKMGDCKKLHGAKKFTGTFYVILLWAIVGFLSYRLYKISNNLSSLIILVAIVFGVTFMCSKNWILHVGAIVFVAIAVPILLQHIVSDLPNPEDLRNMMNKGQGDFRYNRIYGWLYTEKYQDSAGYQVIQALYAIGSGGFLGKGLGNGTQKLSAIPEAQNDMIFSIICEELGIVGAVMILGLYGYLIYQLTLIVRESTSVFGSAIVIGVIVHITCQVVINVGVATNMIPNTGVGLPFISYGGTSILVLMVEMGLCIGIRRQQVNRKYQKAKGM